MHEFTLTGTGPIFPHCCIACNSQHDLIDTMSETAIGRVYFCKSCARRCARIFGFSPGKKLDELQNASEILVRKEAEQEKLLEEITGLRMECGTERKTVKDLQGRLQYAEGRLQQIEHLAATVERGARELVEAVAPQPVLEQVA